MRFIDRPLLVAPAALGFAVFVMGIGGCARAPHPESTRPVPSATSPVPPVQGVARARHWDEYRMQAAQRLVQANPTMTYLGVPPEPLLAIPVLEVELNGDGSVASIHVKRMPSQATDTVQLAIAAVRRASPFGPVSHLPKPWRYTEVFLFDDDRHFKPRTLD